MNLENIKIGNVYKNYKELCEVLGEPVKGGLSKQLQLKRWSQNISWNKNGNKFIITNFTYSGEVITEKEFIDKFANEKQKEKYEITGKMGSMRTAIMSEANRFCDIEYNKESKNYKIFRYYKYPVPKKIGKMKKGIYEYIVPTLMLHVKNCYINKNNVNVTAKSLAKQIKMFNENYDVIKKNSEIICSDLFKNLHIEIDGIHVGGDYYNYNDFFQKVDQYISYYIESALKLLSDTGAVKYQKVYKIVYTNKNNWNFSVNEDEKIIKMNKNTDVHIRKATKQEIDDIILIEQTVDDVLGVDVKKNGIKDRYYGEKSKLWKSEYRNLINQYCKDKDYIILAMGSFYEIYAGTAEICSHYLQYFDYESEEQLHYDFVYNFTKLIMDKANDRYDKKLHNYNDNYIPDFDNLTKLTIGDIGDFTELITNNLPAKREYSVKCVTTDNVIYDSDIETNV